MEKMKMEQDILEQIKSFLNHEDLRIDVKKERGRIESIVITKESLRRIKAEENNFDNKELNSKAELQEEITAMLINLGMPAHLKGFSYVREAILSTYEDREVVTSVTKLLYPGIAKKFNTSAQKVERAIRNAIDVSWRRGNIRVIDEMFGNTVNPMKGRPTNSEFIAMFADILKIKYKNLK